MRIVNFLAFTVITVFIVSCSTPEEKMTKYLSGKWETVFFKLEMPTYQKKDTLIEYDVDFANPEDPRAKGAPVSFTIHRKDGTFKTWQENQKRPVGSVTKGDWKVVGDSLLYEIKRGEEKIKISFAVAKVEDGFSMTGIQDRDRDGEEDDTFYLETVRRPYDEKEE
jgi:hypothetical protein